MPTSNEVTDDEYALLLIMQEGQSVAAIGRWEKPLDALVERGLARRLDKFNNIITTEGRKACGSREQADDAALRRLAPQIDGKQREIEACLGQAVTAMANAANLAANLTNDGPETALINLNIEMLRRAREMLRG